MTTSTRLELDVDGRTRTLAVVTGPDTRPRTAPRPLVLVLHGSRQSGAAHRTFTGGSYDRLATEHGAVVAYLDGYRGNWNDARRESAFPARRENVDDVGFVRRVVAHLAATHDVDPGRVHAVGYSNGGQMVPRLLHEAPALLPVAALGAAPLPGAGGFAARSRAPAPRLMPCRPGRGAKDRVVPCAGGRCPALTRRVFHVDGTALSAPETARYLARRNGITAE